MSVVLSSRSLDQSEVSCWSRDLVSANPLSPDQPHRLVPDPLALVAAGVRGVVVVDVARGPVGGGEPEHSSDLFIGDTVTIIRVNNYFRSRM